MHPPSLPCRCTAQPTPPTRTVKATFCQACQSHTTGTVPPAAALHRECQQPLPGMPLHYTAQSQHAPGTAPAAAAPAPACSPWPAARTGTWAGEMWAVGGTMGTRQESRPRRPLAPLLADHPSAGAAPPPPKQSPTRLHPSHPPTNQPPQLRPTHRHAAPALHSSHPSAP